jgi:hypothetical protein
MEGIVSTQGPRQIEHKPEIGGLMKLSARGEKPTKVLVGDLDVNQWELIVFSLERDNPNRMAEAAKTIGSAMERIHAKGYDVMIIRDDMLGQKPDETLAGLKDAGVNRIIVTYPADKMPESNAKTQADAFAIRPVDEKNINSLLAEVRRLEGPIRQKN